MIDGHLYLQGEPNPSRPLAYDSERRNRFQLNSADRRPALSIPPRACQFPANQAVARNSGLRANSPFTKRQAPAKSHRMEKNFWRPALFLFTSGNADSMNGRQN